MPKEHYARREAIYLIAGVTFGITGSLGRNPCNGDYTYSIKVKKASLFWRKLPQKYLSPLDNLKTSFSLFRFVAHKANHKPVLVP